MGIIVINGDPNNGNEKGLCEDAGISMDQRLLILVARTGSPDGISCRDLFRKCISPGVKAIIECQHFKNGGM